MSPYPNGKSPERIFRTMRNQYQGFPWTGDSGMGITASSAAFNPAFKVYSLPISDASRPDGYKFEAFDEYVYEFQAEFHIGDTVSAIRVDRANTDEEVSVYGKLADYKIDFENKRIRVWVRNMSDMSVVEVYPETIFNNDGLYESCKKLQEEKYSMILG